MRQRWQSTGRACIFLDERNQLGLARDKEVVHTLHPLDQRPHRISRLKVHILYEHHRQLSTQPVSHRGGLQKINTGWAPSLTEMSAIKLRTSPSRSSVVAGLQSIGSSRSAITCRHHTPREPRIGHLQHGPPRLRLQHIIQVVG